MIFNPLLRPALALITILLAVTFAPAQSVAPPNNNPQGIVCAYNTALPTLSPGTAGWVQCDSAGRLIVSSSTTGGGIATIYSGQQTATASAAALPSQALANGIVVTAKIANTGTIYIGPSGVTSSTGYPLVAGQSISYAVANVSSIYILDSVTTDGVAFTGN